ncbi:unnamed protein product [Moneuplotes crassus]|uniref:Uncharacterized protein n=1 Tax=Euplotes crassus TaxID=5936 RepID=A0AAD1XEW5_EUPCR|nr:unnamed protein product [Moneuplotes crassus]
MESTVQTVEEKATEISSSEMSLLRESKSQENQRCASIFYNVLSQEIKNGPLDSDSSEDFKYDEFILSFKNPKHAILAQKLKYSRFFKCEEILLFETHNRNRHILDFMNVSFPSQANGLYICSSNVSRLARSTYFAALIKISSKVICNAEFGSFLFNSSQLKRLMAAYRHVKSLSLKYCKLSIPSVPDFSRALRNCQIKSIDLLGSGGSCSSDWANHFDEFDHLIQGLASSKDLKLNLRSITIYNCGIELNKAQEIFRQNQLVEVQIIG